MTYLKQKESELAQFKYESNIEMDACKDHADSLASALDKSQRAALATNRRVHVIKQEVGKARADNEDLQASAARANEEVTLVNDAMDTQYTKMAVRVKEINEKCIEQKAIFERETVRMQKLADFAEASL